MIDLTMFPADVVAWCAALAYGGAVALVGVVLIIINRG
jgi:hypothetical protein